MSNIKNPKLSVLLSGTKPISHKVGDVDVQFYPMSAACLFKLRVMASRIADIVAVFTDNKEGDSSSKTKKLISAGDSAQSEEVLVDAVPISVIQYRMNQRKEAIGNMVDQILSDDMKEVMYSLIRSSLRVGDEDLPSCEEFFREIPTDALIETLVGCFKANRRILGPFSESLPKAVKGAMERMERKMESESETETEQPQAGKI